VSNAKFTRPQSSQEADVLQYIGQAAYISQNTGAFSNPFFNSVPPGMFYPSLVIAILAAIVASQTMIRATFQVGYVIMKIHMRTETTYADRDAVAFANHQIIILPSNQSETHFEDLPRPNLYSLGELAPHAWHDMCGCSVKQRKLLQNHFDCVSLRADLLDS